MKYSLIEKADLPHYLKLASRRMRGQFVEIEIIGNDIGDQIERQWCSSDGIAFDPFENILYVYTRPLSHMIFGPEDINVAEDGLFVRYMTLKDQLGHIQVIHFREPLRLQAPPPLVDASY